MAAKVTYTDKNGHEASVCFSDPFQAEAYARGVKNARITYIHAEVETRVTKLGTAGQENYKRRKAAQVEQEWDDLLNESAGKLMSGAMGSLIHGKEDGEAQIGRAFAHSNVGSADTEVEIVCACGRKCGRKATVCYICRRYA